LGALAFATLSFGFSAPAQAYHGYGGGGVTLSFGDPYSGVHLSVPIGHRYHHRRYYGYDPYYRGGHRYYHPYGYSYPRRAWKHHWRGQPRHWGYYPRGHYRSSWGHRPHWRDHGWRHPRGHHRRHWGHHPRWH
jgi:hypothetical protein